MKIFQKKYNHIMNGLIFNICKLKGVNCKIKKNLLRIFFIEKKIEEYIGHTSSSIREEKIEKYIGDG